MEINYQQLLSKVDQNRDIITTYYVKNKGTQRLLRVDGVWYLFDGVQVAKCFDAKQSELNSLVDFFVTMLKQATIKPEVVKPAVRWCVATDNKCMNPRCLELRVCNKALKGSVSQKTLDLNGPKADHINTGLAEVASREDGAQIIQRFIDEAIPK